MKIKKRYTVAFLFKKRKSTTHQLRKGRRGLEKWWAVWRLMRLQLFITSDRRSRSIWWKQYMASWEATKGKTSSHNDPMQPAVTAGSLCWKFYKYLNIPRHAKAEGSIKALRVVNENNLGIVSLHTYPVLCSSSDVLLPVAAKQKIMG